jgi:hypothetical protein
MTMRVTTIIILAVATMAVATFAHPRDCRHACKMDAHGVVVMASLDQGNAKTAKN